MPRAFILSVSALILDTQDARQDIIIAASETSAYIYDSAIMKEASTLPLRHYCYAMPLLPHTLRLSIITILHLLPSRLLPHYHDHVAYIDMPS